MFQHPLRQVSQTLERFLRLAQAQALLLEAESLLHREFAKV